jgi:hypothetical protein
MSRVLVPQTTTDADLSLLEQLKVVAFSLAFSGLEHFQRRFSRLVERSDAVTPGSGFCFAAARAGFIEKRNERVIAGAKKR